MWFHDVKILSENVEFNNILKNEKRFHLFTYSFVQNEKEDLLKES